MKLKTISRKSMKGVIERINAVTTIVEPIWWYQSKSESTCSPANIGIHLLMGLP
jgi:hypothetical protein